MNISLLGLQDFPGQGTALVGILNSHLEPKPCSFAQPERFRKFFTDQLPLALLPKYTYENTETLEAEIKIANFGKGELSGEVYCRLEGQGVLLEAALPRVSCLAGRLTPAGRLSLPRSIQAQFTTDFCSVGTFPKQGSGRVLVSSMALQDLQQYPEARALLSSIYRYLGSAAFEPAQELSIDDLSGLVSGK